MASRLLIVLEQPWYDFGENPKMASVLPFVEGLERSPLEVDFDVVYLQFTDKVSLESSLGRVAQVHSRYKSVYLYVASHGSDKKVGNIQFGSFRNAVREYADTLNRNGSELVGVLVGSCLFGDHKEIGDILPGSTIQWIAGYNMSVDWLTGTMFEILFLHKFITCKHVVDTKDEAVKALRSLLEFFNPITTFGSTRKHAPAEFFDSIRCWVQGKGQGAHPQELANNIHQEVIVDLMEVLEIDTE